MVHGLLTINLRNMMCEACIMSKQHRRPFQKHVVNKTSRTLELVHSDVCGTISVLSLGKNSYFVTFVDDFSRKIWVSIIKQKSEVLEVFKTFKLMDEKQSGNSLKILRIDGGGEYNSDEFNKYCADKGTIHEVTIPYTPQQNGIIERRNRTILNIEKKPT